MGFTQLRVCHRREMAGALKGVDRHGVRTPIRVDKPLNFL
jgi:hypothetical protein